MPNAEESIPLGALLRQYRIAAGLTQEALAERTGLGVRSIQHLEGGAHLPHRETIDRLIRGLGLSAAERRQFERVGQPTPRPRDAVSVPSGEIPGDVSRPRSPRHNLPTPLTSFVGREQEMGDVKRLLRAHRLITLTGTGGCGKTRLALQVAAELVDHFPDGVWLVELAPLADPSLVPPTVASAIGVAEQPPRPLLDTLVDALRLKHLVVLLDNCEHLIDVCAHLADTLLRGCPAVRVLATSREALGIAGEVAWRVPSLTLPAAHRVARREGEDNLVLGSEAAQLFVERARLADRHFAATPANAPAIAQICRRLDGIPLALELAAARLNVLDVAQIAARLDDRFRLLTGGSRTALPRQQTLRATLDWSYTLLSESERRLLRRLAVFVSGCTFEAAAAVCGSSDVAEGDLLDLLSQLVDKSLVVVDKDTPEPRYRLLETIRQYGRDRLVEAEEAQWVRERHCAWFLRLAERAEPELIGPRQREWLDRLEGEIDNLREALDWSMGRAPAEHALRLAGALGWLWEARDYWSEGKDWLERALAAPEAAERNAARAKALDFVGNLSLNLDQVALSRAAYEECLAICQEIGDRRRGIEAAQALGLLALGRRELDQGTMLLADVLAQARAVGDHWIMARGLDGSGAAAFERRDDATSRHLLAESVDHYRAVGDWRALGSALQLLGRVVGEQGDFAIARALLTDALELYRDLRMKARTIFVLGDLGIVTWLDGDPERAEALLREGEALARDSGIRTLINGALVARAFIARSDANASLAGDLVAEAWKVDGGSESVLSSGGRGLGLRGLLSIDRGADVRGVRILGAAAQWCTRWFSLLGEDRARDEAMTLARARIGDGAVATAYAEGQTMTLEQAVAEALSDDDVTAGDASPSR